MKKYFDKKIIASSFVGASIAAVFGVPLVMMAKRTATNAVK